jgi:hypothetical protein
MASRNPEPDAARNWNHRRDSAFKTRDSAAGSTSDQTMIRAPPQSTISIWPDDPGLASSAASAIMVTGRIGIEAFCSDGSAQCWRTKKDDESQAIGRSKGGLSTKIHALVDALGNPLDFILTPGQAHDLQGADTLLPNMAAETLLADKASAPIRPGRYGFLNQAFWNLVLRP